ncbi:ATP-binding cassette domain-containing protein [Novosphingobium sp.]|uniref:molybdenum ABC transporter ATP-binding protein n=1 Tax=Novosphingobium sp. TaxID=1874826 RepID=UPI00333F225E
MTFEVAVTLRRGARRIDARFSTGAGITALCGPSGAGKSTVLAAMAGLVRPDSGRIVVAGTVLYDDGQRICVPPHQRACGMVFQDLRLFPHLTVAANLRYGEARAPAERRIVDFDETVHFLDIAGLLARRPGTLSGGEAQRVAIGRALLVGPRFLLLDEPLASLDPVLRLGLMGVIERVRDHFALPIVLVSHAPDEVARLADHVVLLD